MVSLRWMRGASPFFCPFFRPAVLGLPFTETSPAGFLFIVCQLIRWRGPSPPLGPFGFFGAVARATPPPIRPALFNLRRPRRMTAGSACAVACGGRSLALAAADKD